MMENNTGVLVPGHGSSPPHNKEVVSVVAGMVEKSNGNTIVETTFLNIDTPTLHEGLFRWKDSLKSSLIMVEKNV